MPSIKDPSNFTLLDRILLSASCAFDRLPLKKGLTLKRITGNIEYDGSHIIGTIRDSYRNKLSVGFTYLYTTSYHSKDSVRSFSVEEAVDVRNPSWFKVFTSLEKNPYPKWVENESVTSATLDHETGNISVLLSASKYIQVVVFSYAGNSKEVSNVVA